MPTPIQNANILWDIAELRRGDYKRSDYGKVIDRMESNQGITDRIMNEDRFAAAVRELLLERVYRRLQEP